MAMTAAGGVTDRQGLHRNPADSKRDDFGFLPVQLHSQNVGLANRGSHQQGAGLPLAVEQGEAGGRFALQRPRSPQQVPLTAAAIDRQPIGKGPVGISLCRFHQLRHGGQQGAAGPEAVGGGGRCCRSCSIRSVRLSSNGSRE